MGNTTRFLPPRADGAHKRRYALDVSVSMTTKHTENVIISIRGPSADFGTINVTIAAVTLIHCKKQFPMNKLN